MRLAIATCLQTYLSNSHQSKGQRQGDGDRGGYQRRGAPVPKADQGNQHNERHSLPERSCEQSHILSDLARLIRCASNNQVRRKKLFHNLQGWRPRLSQTPQSGGQAAYLR